jgi:uridine kinase
MSDSGTRRRRSVTRATRQQISTARSGTATSLDPALSKRGRRSAGWPAAGLERGRGVRRSAVPASGAQTGGIRPACGQDGVVSAAPDSPVRRQVPARITDEILALRDPGGYTRVAIDGVDGGGKTYLADELAAEFADRGIPTVRAGADGFHHPPPIRHRRARDSPVLLPGQLRLSPDDPPVGGPALPGWLRTVCPGVLRRARRGPGPATAATGPRRRHPAVRRHLRAPAGAAAFWDYSIWLQVPGEISIPRGAARGYGDPDPQAPANRRYVQGQQLYLAECRPDGLPR